MEEKFANVLITLIYGFFTIGSIITFIKAYAKFKKNNKMYDYKYYIENATWGYHFVFWWSILTTLGLLLGISYLIALAL